MKRTRLIFYLSLLAVLTVLMAACAAPPAAPTGQAPAEEAAESADAAGDSTIVIAIAEDTASYDPQRSFETLPNIVLKATNQNLVTFPTGSVEEIIPDAASGWEISEDGTVYTFTIADGITFSDGSPLTAEDVVFSFNRLINLKGNPSFLADGIVSVEAPDEGTVVMTLEQPDPAILAKLIYPAFAIVNKDVVVEQGGTDAEDAATTDTAEEWLNQNSAGSGPYILESWEPSVETVLVRNENYWGEPAPMDRIIFRNIPEAATQKIQLEAGDIDIAWDLTADQVATMEGNEAVTIYQGLSDTLIFLKGNQDPEIGGPAADPLVQEAIRYALDYEGMRVLAGGQTVTPAAMLPVGYLGAYEANSGPARDLDRVAELLAEAGYADGVELELAYPDFTFGGVNFGTFAQKVQADLAEAGFTVTLAPAEVQVALEAYRQGTEPFGLWLWLPDYIDSLDYVEFLPDGVVGNRVNWTSDNADAEIIALRDALKMETDDDVRARMFGEMQDYLIAQGPYAPLIQPGMQVGLSSDLEGFNYNPLWRVDVSLLSK